MGTRPVTLRAMLSPRRRRCGHVLLPTLSWAFRAYWGNSKSLGAEFNELRKIFIIFAMCNAQFYTSPPKETLQSTDPFFCKSMIVNTIFDTFLFCRQYFFSSLWTKGVLLLLFIIIIHLDLFLMPFFWCSTLNMSKWSSTFVRLCVPSSQSSAMCAFFRLISFDSRDGLCRKGETVCNLHWCCPFPLHRAQNIICEPCLNNEYVTEKRRA